MFRTIFEKEKGKQASAEFMERPAKCANSDLVFLQAEQMVGILLIMHEPLGHAFVTTATHMFNGAHERLEAIDVKADQDLNEINTLAIQAISRLDDGDGVLVLTDVIGGTPSNCCLHIALTAQAKVEVVAGVSLPMLLRAITYRENDMETVIEKALTGGKTGAVRIDGC